MTFFRNKRMGLIWNKTRHFETDKGTGLLCLKATLHCGRHCKFSLGDECVIHPCWGSWVQSPQDKQFDKFQMLENLFSLAFMKYNKFIYKFVTFTGFIALRKNLRNQGNPRKLGNFLENHSTHRKLRENF